MGCPEGFAYVRLPTNLSLLCVKRCMLSHVDDSTEASTKPMAHLTGDPAGCPVGSVDAATESTIRENTHVTLRRGGEGLVGNYNGKPLGMPHA